VFAPGDASSKIRIPRSPIDGFVTLEFEAANNEEAGFGVECLKRDSGLVSS
jgi:hypothetical protein